MNSHKFQDFVRKLYKFQGNVIVICGKQFKSNRST